jgi:mono/diheme cytochrome c family protein
MKTILTISIMTAAFAIGTSSARADAAELWAKNCASCHAKDGSGSTAMGKKSKVKDYRDAAVQAGFSDSEATKVITDGKEAMKPFKDKLKADEIKSLVAFVRTLKK